MTGTPDTSFFKSPLVQLALDMVLKLDPKAKLQIVEVVASTLSVRPGFWEDPSGTPTAGVSLLELGEGSSLATRYIVATFADGVWKTLDANQPVTLPVVRWATIPL